MSIRGAATLAVTRDRAISQNEAVSAAEVGREAEGGSSSASWLDVLTTLIPTGIIAGYTFLLTMVLGAIDQPSPEHPDPDQLLGIRVPGFAVFIALTWWLAYRAYQDEADTNPRRSVPLEVWLATLSFTLWGLAAPGTWLIPALDLESQFLRVFAPAAIAVVGALFLAGFSGELRKKLPPPPPSA